MTHSTVKRFHMKTSRPKSESGCDTPYVEYSTDPANFRKRKIRRVPRDTQAKLMLLNERVHALQASAEGTEDSAQLLVDATRLLEEMNDLKADSQDKVVALGITGIGGDWREYVNDIGEASPKWELSCAGPALDWKLEMVSYFTESESDDLCKAILETTKVEEAEVEKSEGLPE